MVVRTWWAVPTLRGCHRRGYVGWASPTNPTILALAVYYILSLLAYFECELGDPTGLPHGPD